MNEKPTIPNRKIHDLYFSASRESLEQRHSQYHEQELCLQHSLPIQYICFSCSNRVLCSQCMTEGNHIQHDIKNIERSKQFLKSQLQQWSIRLELKSQLLQVFYDQIRSNSADVHEFAELYKQKLSTQFQQIMKVLKQKLEILKKSVDHFSNDYKTDCLQKLQKIRTRRLQLSKMISIIKNKIQKTTIHHQAQYYSQKKHTIDNLLSQAEISFYKQQFVEPNWGVDSQTFKKIQNEIDKISVKFKYPQPFRDFFEFKQNKQEINKKSIKKSKKDLKLESDKQQRLSSKARYSNSNTITPFLATYTPKNNSKEKKIKCFKKQGNETLLKKRKKSSNKIVSMPASPEREPDISTQNSPSRSRKNLFKKKDQ